MIVQEWFYLIDKNTRSQTYKKYSVSGVRSNRQDRIE